MARIFVLHDQNCNNQITKYICVVGTIISIGVREFSFILSCVLTDDFITIFISLHPYYIGNTGLVPTVCWASNLFIIIIIKFFI